uniref:Uncharacterized protein n=1 Tax=Triticum urartu TaxID=4572 RepID=A0A8R7QMX2_TRIUA
DRGASTATPPSQKIRRSPPPAHLPTRRYHSPPPPHATPPAPRAPTPSPGRCTSASRSPSPALPAGPTSYPSSPQSVARGHASALPVALAVPPRRLPNPQPGDTPRTFSHEAVAREVFHLSFVLFTGVVNNFITLTA